MSKRQPDETARSFFQTLIQSQCHVCWSMFTHKTQQEFLKWTLSDIYTRNREAAEKARLGPAEIKIMFECNDPGLMRSFWRRFLQKSEAQMFLNFAYFETLEIAGKIATVEARLVYPNGHTDRVHIKMFSEGGSWKMGYLESGLPF